MANVIDNDEGGIFSPRGSLTAWTVPRSRVAARLHGFFSVAVGVLRTSGPARGSERYVPHGRYALPTARLPAVHLRRGDFEQHCAGLELDSAGWQGINEADGLMDRYTPPLGGLQDPADHTDFARHCWLSIDGVMQHVRRVREEWEEGLPGRIESVWRDAILMRVIIRMTPDRETTRQTHIGSPVKGGEIWRRVKRGVDELDADGEMGE
ncbi:hypothetical protein JB92DRAFT_2176549 [Gautieria morchelliformis]|nr:hypothetical protein JB92DRAFT_2176549 [Gautieria morchelliformis]